MKDLGIVQLLASHTRDAFLVTEAEPLNYPDGPKIIYVNEAFTEMTGYQPDEVIGQTPRMLQAPEVDRDATRALGKALARWQPARATLLNQAKSGRKFWVELDIVPVADENGWYIYWVSVQRDVTERVNAENKLLSVLQAAPVAILSISEDEQILSASAASEVMFGWKADELVGKTLNELIPHEHRERHQKFVQSSFNSSKRGSTWDMAISSASALHKSGQEFPVAVRLTHTELDARPVFIVTVEDQSALEYSRMELQAKLLELEKANSAKAHFLAHMSHELRTPLNAIIGFSDLLLSGTVKDQDSGEIKEYISFINNAGNDLLTTINSILDISHFESESTNSYAKTFDFGNFAEEEIKSLSIKFNSESRTCIYNNSDNSIICADKMHMRQLLYNIFNNASRYTIDREIIYVCISNPDSSSVELSIKDEGNGISKEDLARVFQPFERGDDVFVSGKTGTGLGLAIAKRLTELNNGTISLESEVGIGTTVTVQFPLVSYEDEC